MPLACVWGEEPAGEVLNWLGIPRRHQVQHRSSLEEAQSEDLDGLVLLDLPDHDSTEVEHRLIVDRLVELVDMLVWVVDPQKYADAALHNRYIKPFASHSGGDGVRAEPHRQADAGPAQELPRRPRPAAQVGRPEVADGRGHVGGER